jgi:hypothetical protein
MGHKQKIDGISEDLVGGLIDFFMLEAKKRLIGTEWYRSAPVLERGKIKIKLERIEARAVNSDNRAYITQMCQDTRVCIVAMAYAPNGEELEVLIPIGSKL